MSKNGPQIVFISSVLFGIMGLLIKITTQYLPAGEVAFVRFFFSLVIILALVRSKIINLRFINKPLLIARGLLGGAAQLLYFYAVSMIPLSDAVLLSFTYPIFATIYSFFYLKEPAKSSTVTALIFSLIGVIVVMNPSFKEISVGYYLALLSGALAGGAIVTIRKLRRADSSWAVVYALGVGGMALSGVASFREFILPDVKIIMLLIVLGIVATAGQLLMAYAYKFCTASTGSVISMSTVIVAVLLAYVFLGETLSLTDTMGGAMVLGSSAYLVYSAPRKTAK